MVITIVMGDKKSEKNTPENQELIHIPFIEWVDLRINYLLLNQ